LRRIREEETARYMEKMYRIRESVGITPEIIIVEESEEEKANRLAALEAKMIHDTEEEILKKFVIPGEDEEEDVKAARAKNKALSKAKNRVISKVAEARSGKRTVVGPISEDRMREISMWGAMMVKEQMERKARRSEKIKMEKAKKEAAKMKRERLKAMKEKTEGEKDKQGNQ
ncbi:hypothetical protein, partial [Candidatus Ichthyocystis sparus]